MKTIRPKHLLFVLALLLVIAPDFGQQALAASFHDPRDTPAVAVPGKVSAVPLLAIAKAGKRLVAVGLRGVIATSDDGGKNWRQRPCPVSSDLVAVFFVTPEDGWAVGHDGIVLHSVDGGLHWQKQLDGIPAAKQMIRYYKQRVGAGDTSMRVDLGNAMANGGDGLGDLPWLSVWFRNKQTGYIVGSFGNAMKTDDGGRHWIPWLDHLNDPEGLQLNQMAEIGGRLYIAAEQGVVFRLDKQSDRFEPLQTPYKGDLFGITGDAQKILVFGLDGRVYRSADQGANWQKVDTVAGQVGINAGTTLIDGRVALVTEAGQLLVSVTGAAEKFRQVFVRHGVIDAGVLQVQADQLLIVGTGGVNLVHIKTVSAVTTRKSE